MQIFMLGMNNISKQLSVSKQKAIDKYEPGRCHEEYQGYDGHLQQSEEAQVLGQFLEVDNFIEIILSIVLVLLLDIGQSVQLFGVFGQMGRETGSVSFHFPDTVNQLFLQILLSVAGREFIGLVLVRSGPELRHGDVLGRWPWSFGSEELDQGVDFGPNQSFVGFFEIIVSAEISLEAIANSLQVLFSSLCGKLQVGFRCRCRGSSPWVIV